jgi:hypothetical protein
VERVRKKATAFEGQFCQEMYRSVEEEEEEEEVGS